MAGRPEPDSLKKIALVNFGGIGDEILFAPVLEEVRQYLPNAHLTLFLEDRSRAVKDLLPGVDAVRELDVQGQSRILTFLSLWRMLKNQYFDAVISSGSSPFIPVLLFLSGIPLRVGFHTGIVSRLLLTVAAPLAPRHDRKGYAADMYFALAKSLLQWLLGEAYTPLSPVLPHLKPPPEEDLAWARALLASASRDPSEEVSGESPAEEPAAGPPNAKKIIVHPGVSLVSVRKNILKSWSPGHWANLIGQLCASGHHVFLAGGPDDAEAVAEIREALQAIQSGSGAGHIAAVDEQSESYGWDRSKKEQAPHLKNFTDLYGQTKNLRQLAALMCEADLLLCVDSAPLHIAVGYDTPVVAMFAPTDEKKLLPMHHPRFRAVTKPKLACRPCLWDVRNDSCELPQCLDVSVTQMLEVVDVVLKGD